MNKNIFAKKRLNLSSRGSFIWMRPVLWTKKQKQPWAFQDVDFLIFRGRGDTGIEGYPPEKLTYFDITPYMPFGQFFHRLCWQNDLKALNGTESIFGRIISFVIIKIICTGRTVLPKWANPKMVVPFFRALFLWSIFISDKWKGNDILINPGGGVVVTNGLRRLWHSQCCGTQGRCPPQM